MSDKLAWGLISTGRISGVFAKGLADSKTGYLLAVGSRSQESADKFGDEFNVPRRYGSYEALLADKDVQAVYISTPHPMHAEWAVKSAEAGKHILCEKPLTLDAAEAMAVIDAAKQNDVFLMEAFMYRCSAQTAKLAELIREKAIGEVRIIQATFSFHAGFNPEGRLFKNALGGGGILDVGCYAVSMARMVAGANVGQPFIEPIDVKGFGHLGETGVDEYTSAVMLFPGDIIAQVSTGVALNQENAVRIFGSEGNIYVPSPWFGGEAGSPGKIVVNKNGQPSDEVTVEAYANQYTIEADIVAKSIKNRQAPPPAMTPDDSLGNMKTCDRWRKSIGLIYDIEKPDADFPTIDRRPVKARPGNNMQYGKLAGLDKPVSRLVIGTVGGAELPFASMMFDEFFRCGGNSFDTAHIYGTSDATLGQWIKNRGIREQAVILAKGAHTPNCNPEALTQQLLESLDRMQTDYADIYIMHRDNPDIPAGEFIDALNEHQKAGRIRAFGGSNWSIERVQAANEYAKSKGLNGFSTVNNNFSLARMIRPPWDGCIASSDPESRAWLTKTQLPLMAWSSTGRGFFVRGNRDDTSDPGMMDWYSDDNFQRLDRATELAKKKGVEPINIAMAWVLCQPFPTFALFGPANLDEMRISLRSLDVQLTPEEMKWLNLE